MHYGYIFAYCVMCLSFYLRIQLFASFTFFFLCCLLIVLFSFCLVCLCLLLQKCKNQRKIIVCFLYYLRRKIVLLLGQFLKGLNSIIKIVQQILNGFYNLLFSILVGDLGNLEYLDFLPRAQSDLKFLHYLGYTFIELVF